MARPPRPLEDPSELDPLLVQIPTGTSLFRVHSQDHSPTAFNPGRGGGGRFHFIQRQDGVLVPALYAAEDAYAAVAETIFHDVPARPSRIGQLAGVLSGDRDRLARSLRGVGFVRQVRGRTLTELRTRSGLSLVQLHDLGLKRLGLGAADISDTDPREYPRSRRWAQALYDATACAGLVWMSRLFNSRRAVTLFGDRIPKGELEVAGPPLPLWQEPGVRLIYEIAQAAKVAVFHGW